MQEKINRFLDFDGEKRVVSVDAMIIDDVGSFC